MRKLSWQYNNLSHMMGLRQVVLIACAPVTEGTRALAQRMGRIEFRESRAMPVLTHPTRP